MGIFIEDKYFEQKLDDGSVIWTKTSCVINALNYYKNECLKIISNAESTLNKTPRIMAINSFEKAMEKIHQIQEAQRRIIEARQVLQRINMQLQRIAETSTKINKPDENQPGN